MTDPVRDLTATEAAGQRVVYEQPLTERMRTFLRLEFLFGQLRHHANGQGVHETRAAVASLLDILAILNRGDIRSEAMQELERQANRLQQYQSQPGVDTRRLNELLRSIGELREMLTSTAKNFAQYLRDNEFLSAVRHRSAIPGGTCEFDLPDYNHWLSRPYKQRRADFDGWLHHLEPLEQAITETLWLTRESAQSSEELAVGGMYQQTLERNSTCQLVRVGLPAQSNLYPEISGGQHRYTVRFRVWHTADERPELVTRDVSFELSCC